MLPFRLLRSPLYVLYLSPSTFRLPTARPETLLSGPLNSTPIYGAGLDTFARAGSSQVHVPLNVGASEGENLLIRQYSVRDRVSNSHFPLGGGAFLSLAPGRRDDEEEEELEDEEMLPLTFPMFSPR